MIFCFAAKLLKKRHSLQMRLVLQVLLLCVSRFNFQIVKQNSLFAKDVIGGVLLDTIICNITFRGLGRLLPRPRNGSL